MAAVQSWCVDEIHPKIRGRVHRYRAAELVGQTVDTRLSTKRDVKAAKAILQERNQTSCLMPHVASARGLYRRHRS
ncbi:DDE-type integrase/transposase/recombinase [Caballeronia sordidicola]|uniref:DDE-type integrase/transposase/recombinase n=1 Tax=Caballeronia sordidicola TaxID=196367 RepID=UPI000691B832|nr:DDE-type integrase/transposase/recombinase [Caballeronia sordidicola]